MFKKKTKVYVKTGAGAPEMIQTLRATLTPLENGVELQTETRDLLVRLVLPTPAPWEELIGQTLFYNAETTDKGAFIYEGELTDSILRLRGQEGQVQAAVISFIRDEIEPDLLVRITLLFADDSFKEAHLYLYPQVKA